MNLAETWGYLEGDVGAAGGAGRVQRRILPRGRRNVFLALEVPTGNRMMILRVSTGSLAGCAHTPPIPGGWSCGYHIAGIRWRRPTSSWC